MTRPVRIPPSRISPLSPVTSATTGALAIAAGIALVCTALAAPASAEEPDVSTVTGTYSSLWDSTAEWTPLSDSVFGPGSVADADATIVVDPAETFQNYEGLGISIDETAVSNLFKLPESERRATIRRLVSPTDGAGLDQFRLTIGSPDLIEHLPFWSYDELPEGVTDDFELEHFSIQKDIDFHIIETIKLIQEYNPDARFFGSAWSAPAWMKTSNTFTGYVEPKADGSGFVQAGRLRDDCIDVFARYYVKFIQAYAEQGIDVEAITMLNEPGMDVVYPAMDISIPQQQKLALAIKREFAAAGLDTKLWAHDFNFWDWRDPNSTETKNYYRVFEDSADGSVKGADVLDAVDGVAFHPYWGDASVMRDANKETGLPVYMTESGGFDPSTVIDYMRLNAANFIAWAQITDQDGGTLHWTDKRDNNVDWEQVAATSKWRDRLVTAHLDTGVATFKPILGGLGQLARYLDTDDVRVQSSASAGGLSNVVFRDADGNYTAIVRNAGDAQQVEVALVDRSFTAEVPAASMATFRWHADLPPAEGNHAPELAPLDDVTVDQFGSTSVQLQASDLDGDPVRFYGVDLPAGVSVDSATGLVTIAPTRAGEFDLRFVVTDGVANSKASATLTVAPKPVPVGMRVEAEAYTDQNGWTVGTNFIENTSAASGGQNVGWTAAGNWLSYEIDVPAAGTYGVEFGVASGLGTPSPEALSLRDAAGTGLATLSIEPTGGWAAYATVSAHVTLPAGVQTVTVFCNTGGFNLDYFELTPLVASTTQLSLSDDKVRYGEELSATVTVEAGEAVPDGEVEIVEGETVVASAELTDGAATVDLTGLDAGTHQLVARYGGADDVLASSSDAVSVRVLKARLHSR